MSDQQKLLIVDDDEDIRSQMKWGLMDDYDVLLAEDRPSALETFQEHRPWVVLLDLGLPPNPGDTTEGLTALSEILAQSNLTKVIVITGQSEHETAIQAIGQGAYDFLPKPVEMEPLKLILQRAFHIARLERDFQSLQQKLEGESFEGMLGNSPQMQQIFSSIKKVATTEAPVLILGESGTGKEKAALAIHRRSNRHEGPFVAINCGAIPENLLESELFGHEKGAFTGAHTARPGRFETAVGGTLFLDEVGELPLNLQVKLLRFLQEQTIERVGGRKPITIDTRVVAATNMDLRKAITDNRFREDLYYRLAVIVIKLPPLRDRQNDIPLLANAFLQKFAAEGGREPPRFTQMTLRALDRHSWPGNVRELENRVKRAFIMAEGRKITVADLELTDTAAAAPVRTLKEARDELEREMILNALRKHKNNISATSNELGISRPTLYELMEKLQIERA